MKCKLCQDSLTSFVLNDLSEIEQTSIEAHLQTCHDCMKELASIKVVLNILDEQISHKPSKQMQTRFSTMLEESLVSQKAKQQSTPKQSFFQSIWPTKPAWAFSYSFSVLIIGALMGQLPQSSWMGFGQPPSLYTQLDNLSEDNLIQICAVQNSSYFETL